MPRRPHPLRVEALEDRVVPSASVWGTPWPDGQHLTLSIAPDGTNISGVGSSLSQVLAEAGPSGELALLEAFQTWADYAKINYGLVADGGQAFGIGKAIQDDPRFGDIRIGAIPLSNDVVAITSPFDYFNTYSGDVVLNSAQPIGSTYNLYTVALHEAGHALGLPDNNDPNSVMYEYYTGANVALDASDIAAIQGLYGARTPNTTSNTLATALKYITPVYAQLNSATDADYYKFSTPLLFPGTTIHLQAKGLSLLDATVSVYNSRGTLVASTTATDPTNNDLTLNLNNLGGLSTYYVKVSSPNGGVFDVGTYNMSITNNLTTLLGDVVGGTLGLLGGIVGHTLGAATDLVANTTGINLEVNYNARASLNSSTQTDFYAIQAPAYTPETMVATVWTLGNQNLTPRLQVFDSSGNPVAFQVLTDTSGASTIQVVNPVPGQRYELEVKSASGQTGTYSFAVDFLSSPIQFPMNASGPLNSSASSASANLVVQQSQVMHFVLSAGVVSADPKTVVMMTILDSNGNVVGTLQTTAGNAASLDVFLGVGSYTVTVSATSSSGGSPQPVEFDLSAIGLTDPVGVAKANPTSNPSGSSSSTTTTTTTSSSSTPPTTISWSSSTPTGNAIWN
ncbi:MAG TPA: matrixin family metalloprotease [Gemmata sp.]|nr:matrixin family metalloprotease [Gemmata sp.]